MPIRLRFSELREEIDHFKVIARNLLDSDGEKNLASFSEGLTAIQSLPPGRPYSWEISDDRPLRTIESVGEYEANGRRGAHQRLIVEMTCIWQIIPIASAGKKGRPGKVEVFEVGGLASTRVNMRELSGPVGNDSIGSWRMELGAPGAPGCFFHTQILGEDGRNDWPYPHSMSVPRLPSFFFTPITVLDFALGEVFQDKWRSPTRQGVSGTEYWASIQRKRFKKLFDWYQNTVQQSGKVTPWCYLKQQIPQPDCFV